MDELLVISGKGGTGKTSVTAAFAGLADNAVICDLDVDAPDLHLIASPRIEETFSFMAGHRARIVADRCDDCGLCREVCRFDAIVDLKGRPCIDPIACEGCKVCVARCPKQAIDFTPRQSGHWYRSRTRFGELFHAQLSPGEENSGKLVALLRRQARQRAAQQGASLIVADGPPGIGCPVISAMSGTTLAVVVIEPTPSGHHDLMRTLYLCRHFGVPAAVVINKADLSEIHAERIRLACAQAHVPIVGRIPFDHAFVTAMIRQETVVEHGAGPAADALRHIWTRVCGLTAAQSFHPPSVPADVPASTPEFRGVDHVA